MDGMEYMQPADTPFLLIMAGIIAIGFLGLMYGLGALFASDAGE
jgi:hypothetical protein